MPSHNTLTGRYKAANVDPGSLVVLNHWDTAGSGRVRKMTSPMNPSVPREPTSRRHRSKPDTFFTVGPPAFTISPAADRYRVCSRASRTGPYPRRRIPLWPTANAPPTVPDGGSATHWPTSAKAASRSRTSVAAPHETVISSAWIQSMPLGAATTRPPGTAPPDLLELPAMVTWPAAASPTVAANSVRSTRPPARAAGPRTQRRLAAPCRDLLVRWDRRRGASRPAQRGRLARTSGACSRAFPNRCHAPR